MVYTLIIIATITRFGTIGGAGIAIDHINFVGWEECEKAATEIEKHNSNVDAFCVSKGAKQ